MLTRIDAADRLVLEIEGRGPLPVEEAARILFALRSAPAALARTLLADVIDRDARLDRHGGCVVAAPPPPLSTALDEASFAAIDLETTGFVAGEASICEVGAVLVKRGRLTRELEVIVSPGQPPVSALARLLAFAGDAVLVGHNIRFDVAFLDHELAREGGRRLAAPVVDTMILARRLLRGRIDSASLASLAAYYGTAAEPCHRALPDATATAEILLRMLPLARERGAATVGDLCAFTRTRRAPIDLRSII